MEVDERALMLEVRGRKSSAALDHISLKLESERERIVKSVFVKMKSGKLDPEFAVQRWYALYSLHELERSLRSDAVRGANAGAANKEMHPEIG